jgi:hypothetical protein
VTQINSSTSPLKPAIKLEVAKPEAPAPQPAVTPEAVIDVGQALKVGSDMKLIDVAAIDPNRVGDLALPWETGQDNEKQFSMGIKDALKDLDMSAFFKGDAVRQHFPSSCAAASLMEQWSDKHPDQMNKASLELAETGETRLPNGETVKLDPEDRRVIDAYAKENELSDEERQDMYVEAALTRHFSDGAWSAKDDLVGQAEGLKNQDQLMDMATALGVPAYDINDLAGGFLNLFGFDDEAVADFKAELQKNGSTGMVVTVKAENGEGNHAVIVSMDAEGRVSVTDAAGKPYPSDSKNPREFEEFLDQIPRFLTGDVGNLGSQAQGGGGNIGPARPGR